jgi:hypothetical protein
MQGRRGLANPAPPNRIESKNKFELITICPPFCTARHVSVKIANEPVTKESEPTGPKVVQLESDFPGKVTLMMYFVAFGMIIGILLGLRFRVFVLVPATLIAACAIIATGHGAKTIAVTLLATTALLQIGYVLGCVVRMYADAYARERVALRHRLSRSRPA